MLGLPPESGRHENQWGMMDFNPLWIIVALTALGLAVKGLFWLRDVHTAKEGWAKFTADTFPAFAKEIRGRLDQLFERIPPPKTLGAASPLSLNDLGRKGAHSRFPGAVQCVGKDGL